MFFRDKKDGESWLREKNLGSLKQNEYLQEGDIVQLADNNFYEIVSEETDITLLNNLYAKVIPANIAGNISTAEKLKTPRNIKLSGAISGNNNFDGSNNLEIQTTLNGIDASKITSGIIDIARIPASALERCVVVADDTARFKLTKEQVQVGDSVKVTNPDNLMHIVIDDNKLNVEEGYVAYSAAVKWETIKDKPNTFTPSAHNQDWSTITGKPSSFTPSTHNQDGNTINNLTGYAKAATIAGILPTDSLITALGKLEKAIDGKQVSGEYAVKNHGNHVPTIQTANNKVFLRNDNTWQTITPENIGAQPAGSYSLSNHNHDSVYQPKGNYALSSHNHDDLSNAITEINSFFDLYSVDKRYIKINGDAGIKVLKNTIIKVGEKVFKTNSDITVTASNLDTGSFELGKDYYVYCCNQTNSAIFKISLNSTYPNGFTANNSRKIGGFHYGDCRRITSDTLEPINTSGVAWGTGWEDNVYQGILPFSIWTLLFRPISEPEGMVYDEAIHKWVDIYLCNTSYKSQYNTTPMTGSEGIQYYDWYEKISKKTKKFPLTYTETCSAANGSPNGRDDSNDYCWSKTTNTGRNKTGIIAKAVSSIGLKDCSGNVWKVLLDTSWTTNGSWAWRYKTGKGSIYSCNDYDPRIGLAGGNWSYGAFCGSRTLHCNSSPWYVSSGVGCRLASDSL